MIQRERIVQELMELCAISSPGGQEREIADRLMATLREMGLTVIEDDAGAKIPGNTGNLYARLEGTAPGKALFFSAHMDTVVPCDRVRPVIRDGVIYSDGTSVLGGDDKVGIAAILEALRVILETGEERPTIEVVFSVQEEGGLKGAKVFDTKRLEATMGYVLDAGGTIGDIINAAPFQDNVEAVLHGRTAHAGFCPEEGVSAIKIASRAIHKMKLGRIDGETTANIGMINGGTATNIVPERVTISGEARSIDEAKLAMQTRHMVECFEQAAREMGGRAEVKVRRVYPGYRLTEADPVVALALQAAVAMGAKPKLLPTGGGSDANIYNGAGVPTANLAIGMEKVHTKEEFVPIDALVGSARFVLEIIRQAVK
ncbi:M20/M25/M40 family metallo-hydrolase [Heliobacterium gestii]|uniref:M20/M25/M40 family metallo-hydrolase n=1 Tax=Heliomicrobium gestii TaxID=2699 RepID=A0A845LEZ4_HELGE|nr:M20/M25/M40 family metallo-hydrolase [Heliomicrobium gestii]MBM7865147.1 tripeptide aminopeptidase [Heliomicrobium gestii]MZP41416.1 M20/M25/M40 family metallo-hydrolase [Heliomicrobium gestii]